jgi:hypothetical protein
MAKSKAAPVTNRASSTQKMDVSQASLERLIGGRDQLVQRRQQFVQEVQRLDTLIQQQEGGIQLMQTLLEGVQAAQPDESQVAATVSAANEI